jgi:hypothetical protein
MMEDNLNKEILNWWYQLPDHLRGNEPTFLHRLNPKASILFVGLNPSGDTTNKPPIDSIVDAQIHEKIRLEHLAIFGEGKDRKGQYKTYYKPLTDIADKLKVDFEHCDLFHMSYRKSIVVEREIFDAGGKLKEKHLNHLNVFLSVYRYINPKLVITNNVNSARILINYLNLEFDDVTGLYKDNRGIYFYLNGIMSYGRQTVFDKERLIWAISKVL